MFLPLLRYVLMLALGLMLYSPFECLARDYVPVDQLGRGSTPAASSAVPTRTSASSGATASRAKSNYVTPSGAIKLFGTVEFRRPLNSLPGWLDVLKRNKEDPVFIPEKYFNKQTRWADLKASLSGKSKAEQLRLVNSFWNRWKYIEDKDNWGKPDYWAIPAQFIPRSGDCEDYAIAKYFTLKEAGFDPEKMRIVVLRDTVRNLAHAVLAVYLDDDVYILDNLSKVVLSHRQLGNYLPQFSVNEYGRWSHLKGKK